MDEKRNYKEKFYGAVYSREAPYVRFRSKIITDLSAPRRLDFVGSILTVTDATQAYPCNLEITGHGLQTGDRIYVEFEESMEELNGKNFYVTRVDDDNITLDEIEGASAFASNGTAVKLESFNGSKCHAIVFSNFGTADIYLAESKANATAENAGIILKENGTYDERVDDLSRLWVNEGETGEVDLRMFIKNYGEGD